MKCKKHPKYQAKRMPTADCQPCRDIWNDKLAKNLGAAYHKPYKPSHEHGPFCDGTYCYRIEEKP